MDASESEAPLLETIAEAISGALEEAAIPPTPKRGRRSARDEVQAWLANVGLDPELVDEAPGFAPGDTDKLPETTAELRDELLKLVWNQRKGLKGIALVKAFEAITKLAELHEAQAARDAASAAEEHVDVLDLIQTEGLPPARKRELLTQEWDRCSGRLERINKELEALDE